jgi:cytochrome c-type protein NapC
VIFVLATLALVTVGLVAAVAARPSLTVGRTGKILAFLAFFVLPVLLTTLGTTTHLEHSKSTEFCLSCHVMEPYGRSLHLADTDHLPAGHFQNRRIDRDQACYTCHTTYTMYGGFRAKVRGLKHVWGNYVGTPPASIELYEPYQNRECLHCHARARRFEEDEVHAEVRAELASNEVSCLECHDLVHGVPDLDDAPLWEGDLR